MVTECIEDSVVPFYFEVTMGRGDPTVRDKNDVYSSAIHEKSFTDTSQAADGHRIHRYLYHGGACRGR